MNQSKVTFWRSYLEEHLTKWNDSLLDEIQVRVSAEYALEETDDFDLYFARSFDDFSEASDPGQLLYAIFSWLGQMDYELVTKDDIPFIFELLNASDEDSSKAIKQLQKYSRDFSSSICKKHYNVLS